MLRTLFIAAAAILLAGCGSEGLPRGAIHGRVTLSGQPLTKGIIRFEPAAPTVGPVVSAAIVDGEYRLVEAEGPIVGKQRVEVEAQLDLGFAIDDESAFAARGSRPLPPNPVPPQFNTRSTLTTEIRADQENTFDVSIPAATQTAARR
ncbi:MAG: hypothetical protein WD872_10605 [Pirellulaceae bacterium]